MNAGRADFRLAQTPFGVKRRAMNSFFRVFAILCFAFFPALAQEQPSVVPNVKPMLPAAKPLLWRIEGAKPSYIFGTIHLPDPAIAKISKELDAAIIAADVVLTEIPMDAASNAKMMKEMMGVMMFPDGKTLGDVLPADLHKDLMAEFDRIQPGLGKGLDRIKVVWATMMLGLIEEQLKNPFQKPIDSLVAERGEKLGKETGGLETYAEQMAVFENFTPAEEIAMLRDTLKFMKEFRKQGKDPIKEMKSAYVVGDLAAFDKVFTGYMSMGDDKKLTEKFTRIFLTERNQLMVKRAVLKLRAEPGKSFVFAVGSGHLGGETGMLKLLEKEGFKLVPAAVGAK